MANEKRLIDANVALLRNDEMKNRSDVFRSYAKVVIDGTPTVDAVEVVRCKDCKHWKHFDHVGCSDLAKVCSLANYMIGANGYCLYGERKDNE